MAILTSAGSREILLGFGQEVSDSVTVQIETSVDSLNHLLTGHETHGLCLTFELESVDELVCQDSVRAELNDHGVTLAGDLHVFP